MSILREVSTDDTSSWIVWQKLTVIPESDPLYAPGNETPAGLLLPPPVTWSWTQLLQNKLSASEPIQRRRGTVTYM